MPSSSLHGCTPWLVSDSRRIYTTKYLQHRPIRRAGTTAVIYSFQVTCFIWANHPCSHYTACDVIRFWVLFARSDPMLSTYHIFMPTVRLQDNCACLIRDMELISLHGQPRIVSVNTGSQFLKSISDLRSFLTVGPSLTPAR